MPRRRKDTTRGSAASAIWSVGLYIRLSKEDGNDVSNSVANQRKILMEYVVGQPDLQVYDSYVDDGFTGTDTERASFQRMLADINMGKINCVMVKDISRLSRNYSDAGRFLDEFLVAKNVRFVSLKNPTIDSYRNPDAMNSVLLPVLNVINDDFCRQTSIKIRATFDMKRRAGEFIGAFAPYGYAKNPDNKNELVIDEEAAVIVRLIFRLFANEGYSKIGISKYLNDRGIPNPTGYKRSKGLKYRQNHEISPQSLWSPKTIDRILSSEMYIGNMVQARQKVLSYKIHTRVSIPKDEWMIVKGTHEPIIGDELFAKTQELLRRDTRTAPRKNKTHLFAGMLRCADCNRAMARSSAKGYHYYNCRVFKAESNRACTKHSIREDVLYHVVLETIKKHIEVLIQMDVIIRQLRAKSAAALDTSRIDHLLSAKHEELAKIRNAKACLYIDLKSGLVHERDYRHMADNFDEKIYHTERAIQTLSEEKDEMARKIHNSESSILRYAQYEQITKLDREILSALVMAIYVREDKSIHIQFAFDDHFKHMIELLNAGGRFTQPHMQLA